MDRVQAYKTKIKNYCVYHGVREERRTFYTKKKKEIIYGGKKIECFVFFALKFRRKKIIFILNCVDFIKEKLATKNRFFKLKFLNV